MGAQVSWLQGKSFSSLPGLHPVHDPVYPAIVTGERPLAEKSGEIGCHPASAVTPPGALQQDTTLLLDTEISKHCPEEGGVGQIIPQGPFQLKQPVLP